MSSKLIQLDEVRRICSGCNMRDLCLPAGLKSEEVQRLDKLVQKRRQLAVDEYLFHNGDMAQAVYAVRVGSLKSMRLGEDGSMQIVGIHLPGELFGLDALAESHHQVSVQALETTSICALPLLNLESVSVQIPSLSRQIMRMTSRVLNAGHDNHELLARHSALERVALFLCRYADRRRSCGLRADSFDIAITRQDLANYLGMQLETVSRAFRQLKNTDCIDAKRSLLEIKNLTALREAAGLCDITTDYAYSH